MQCGLAGVLGTWGLLVKSRQGDSVLMYKGKIRLRLYSPRRKRNQSRGEAWQLLASDFRVKRMGAHLGWTDTMPSSLPRWKLFGEVFVTGAEMRRRKGTLQLLILTDAKAVQFRTDYLQFGFE